MDTSVILEFRSIINSVDLMFYTLDSGDYHEWRILKYDELEGYFEETISKIRNFNTQRLDDELAKNINELDNNLKTIRLMLRERPQMIDENSDLFPEDFKCYRSKLLRDGDDKWANGVLCGFMAVASWANGLIEDFFSIISDYEQIGHGNEQERETPNPQYSESLLDLFHSRTDLIGELAGLSDDKIAGKIKQWCKERDNFGKPLIENPENYLKKAYAEALKDAGLINLTVSSFRRKL